MNKETEMSESASVETPVASVQSNGTGAHAFYSHVADLLDDVTVGAQQVAPAEDTLEDLFAGIAPAAVMPPVVPPPAAQSAAMTAIDAALAQPAKENDLLSTAAAPAAAATVDEPDRRPALLPDAAPAALPTAAVALPSAERDLPPTARAMGAVAYAPDRRPEVLPDALPAAAPTLAEARPTDPALAAQPATERDLSPTATAAALLTAGAAADELDRRPEVLPDAPPAAAPPAAEHDLPSAVAAVAALAAGAAIASDQRPGEWPTAQPAAFNDPPPVTADVVAGASFPAWVPPWDESQRPVTAPPDPSDAAITAAQQPERSIFAPLAPVAGAAAGQQSTEQPLAAAPPADLPPFLVATSVVGVAAAAPTAASQPAAISPSALAVAGEEATIATATDETALAGAAAVEGEAKTAPAALVNIRGRMDGVTIELGSGAWSEVMAALTARLGQAASFFREAKVALDVGGRALAEDELSAVATLLSNHGMTLSLVRTGAERTFQSALALGLTVTLEAADGAAMAEAAAATSNAGTAGYFVYRGYLRSGNRLRRKEHILVIGDVNPGAEVISEGDVLVWGRLRGLVHAGAGGNGRAIVAALDMEPTQLRIADVMTASADPQPGQPGKWFWQRSANKRPEVARIVQKAILFEEWDTGRPGGLVSLRRGG